MLLLTSGMTFIDPTLCSSATANPETLKCVFAAQANTMGLSSTLSSSSCLLSSSLISCCWLWASPLRLPYTSSCPLLACAACRLFASVPSKSARSCASAASAAALTSGERRLDSVERAVRSARRSWDMAGGGRALSRAWVGVGVCVVDVCAVGIDGVCAVRVCTVIYVQGRACFMAASLSSHACGGMVW